jgi:ADP-heptose:LPS heptosyltransferase
MASGREKILVIKLGALGDFIQALGPMAAIRKHHPQAEITLLTTAPYREFAESSKYIDHIWIDDKPDWKNIAVWRRLRKKLIESSFTRVYDLQNNDRTALYFKLIPADKKPEWVGAVKGASHRNDTPERTAGHAFEGHKQTLALAGITNVQVDRLEWIQAGITSFPVRKPYVLLVPGSAPHRPEKRWPAQSYARLAKILAQWGYQPVLIGTKSENDAAREIVKDLPAVLDLTGQTTLPQIAALARAAAAAIGNDTGPMHLIAATGCPCLALFSPESDPVRHAPKGDHVVVLQSQDLQTLKPEKVLQLFKPREEPPRQSVSLH